MPKIQLEASAMRAPLAQARDPESMRRLIASCRSTSVATRWASNDMTVVDPFDKERNKRFAKWHSQKHVLRSPDREHGLDHQGSVQWTRAPWYHQAESPGASFTFVERHPEHLTTFCYDWCLDPCASTPATVRRAWHDPSGRPLRRIQVTQNRWFEWRFVWEGELPAAVLELEWQFDADLEPERPPSVVRQHFVKQTLEYADGQLERVYERQVDDDLVATSKRRLVYRRPRPGETLPALSQLIVPELSALIPSRVRQAELRGTYYCVIISYSDEDFSAAWPPYIVLGDERWRREVVKQGETVPYYLWAADELRESEHNVTLFFEDRPLKDHCRLFAELLSQKSSTASGRKVLAEVAQNLNRYDWSTLINVTPDFAVIFADNSGYKDPIKDAQRCISPDHFKALRKQNLI